MSNNIISSLYYGKVKHSYYYIQAIFRCVANLKPIVELELCFMCKLCFNYALTMYWWMHSTG